MPEYVKLRFVVATTSSLWRKQAVLSLMESHKESVIEVVINVKVRARCSSESVLIHSCSSPLGWWLRCPRILLPLWLLSVVSALRYVSPTRSLRGSLFYEAIQGRDKIYGYLFTVLSELELDADVRSVVCAVKIQQIFCSFEFTFLSCYWT